MVQDHFLKFMGHILIDAMLMLLLCDLINVQSKKKKCDLINVLGRSLHKCSLVFVILLYV